MGARGEEAPPPTDREVARLGGLVGTSEVMRAAFVRLRRLAASEIAVLISGETGTGKELAARALHEGSPRAAGPYVVCDLGATPPNLIESELFGHLRGAFTGAIHDRHGAFELAHGGTIFLDEVGELEWHLQPRLLRVLEQHQVKPVGGSAYRPVDVRVVAATNRDLAAEVRAGRFRADLYHRLSGASVYLPPLRERVEDIPVLVEHILRQLTRGPAPRAPRLSGAAMQALVAHDWPGNVRELRNVLERSFSLDDEAPILEMNEFNAAPTPTTDRIQLALATADEHIDLDTPFKQAKDHVLRSWERRYIEALLGRYDGNITLAARRAGIDRVHLHRLVKKHGLEGRTRSSS
jgi:DNA-binding NtrC family response regulator